MGEQSEEQVKTGNGPGEDDGKQENNENPTSPETGKTTEQKIIFESEEKFQERVDAILKERLAREKRKSDEAAKEAKKRAELDALAKNEEWKKLADEREGQIESLNEQNDSAKTQIERYQNALNAQLETAKKNLPKAVIALLDKLDVVEQLEWIAENSSEMTESQPRKNGSVPVSPAPATSSATNQSNLEKARQAYAWRVRKRI